MVVGPKVSSERKERSIQAAWNVGKWGRCIHGRRDRPGDGRVRMEQGRRSAEVGRKREGKKGGGGEQNRVAKPVME
jgi:hypothetical protein